MSKKYHVHWVLLRAVLAVPLFAVVWLGWQADRGLRWVDRVVPEPRKNP